MKKCREPRNSRDPFKLPHHLNSLINANTISSKRVLIQSTVHWITQKAFNALKARYNYTHYRIRTPTSIQIDFTDNIVNVKFITV